MISKAEFIVMRLKPGEELLAGMAEQLSHYSFDAAFVASSVGSLSVCAIRMAGHSDTAFIKGTFEVVSLSGTLDRTGGHLHMSVSDENGNMTGGHLMEGSIVRTTMELVIGILPQMKFTRKLCPMSGYDELCVEKKENDYYEK